jgi:AcrR family transcriptional regulator
VTSRAQILAAARRLIDRDGWEKLTVRRLAADLDIGPTTPYHHVRDKGDLLIQLLNDYFDRTVPPELPGDPRERVITSAVATHDTLASWPWAAEVLTVDGFLGLLGGSALRMVEAILAGAVDCGCTPEQAVHVFRSIWYYTVGEILVRAHSLHRPPDARPTPSFENFDASELPHLAAVGHQWPALAARDIYARGLTALVDGLLAQTTNP